SETSPRATLPSHRRSAIVVPTVDLSIAQPPRACARKAVIPMADDNRAALIADETKMIRRLRILVDLTFALIAQDNSLTLDECWDHVRALKGAAVAMFPGKED